MRSLGILCAVTATCLAAATAVAQAPGTPRGNFGGGALVAPPKDLFGAGNAIVGLRALGGRRLQIEATVRARCAGGDIAAEAKIDEDGAFAAHGSGTQEPDPGRRIRTSYRLAGAFPEANVVEGTVSATLRVTAGGRTKTCKTGKVAFSARRPVGGLGRRGVAKRARYFGVTTQRGVGPRRAIVLRVSGDGRRVSRALFGEHVRCSDDSRAIGIEAPRTNLRISRTGRVSDRERYTIDNGATKTYVDDRFTAVLGRRGAKGTLSLSDRTIDKLTGNVLRSCTSGTVKWVAAP